MVNENTIPTSERPKPTFPMDLFYTTRRTFSGATQFKPVEYEGWAPPGTPNNGSGWIIKNTLMNSDSPPQPASGLWASGEAGPLSFSFVWNDRESYIYE